MVVLVIAVLAGAFGGQRTIALDPGDKWGWEEFYPVELDRSGTRFGWSRPRALIHFRGVDRGGGIGLEVELRAWRPRGVPPPALRIEVDQQVIWNRLAPLDWHTVRLGAGPSGQDHLDLVIDVTLFRPAEAMAGSSDRRALGVEIRRACLVTGSGPFAWVAFSSAMAAAAWALLALLGAARTIRVSWAMASALGGLWIGLSWLRPYALDASPAWTAPLIRLLLLTLLLAPLLLAPS